MIGAEDNPLKPLPASFYRRDTATVARDLLGCRLVRRFPDRSEKRLVIVETEAYLGVRDRAAHTWNGRKTTRVAPMWGPGGHAYVYFVYGMHHCLNVVTKDEGEPEAVLIRSGVPEDVWKESKRFFRAAAAEGAADRRQSVSRGAGVKGPRPLRGARSAPLTPAPRGLRPSRKEDLLVASGPAKVCRYLGITTAFSGAPFSGPDLFLFSPSKEPSPGRFPLPLSLSVLVGPRVGVAYAGEAARWPLRFALQGCPAVTRPAGLGPLARRS